jgi:3-oxoacyl-[acyl-carrier-protein] synthase-3
MPKSQFQRALLRGLVTCVPRTERRIDDEVELFGGNARQIARIKKTIGLDRRRVVEPGVTSADLCGHAAGELLAAAGRAADAVDALVCVTQTPDYLQPCNAAVLHGRMGLRKDCAALDVNLGCSGYVYGLWLAHMMIESGGCATVLLLAGDTVSRLVHPRDRAVAPLFGDGGSATLLEAGEVDSPACFSLGTDGTGFDKLIVPAGGARRPSGPETRTEHADESGNVRCAENLFMDGAEIFNFSIEVEPRAVRELLEYAGTAMDAVDAFVFHQANRYILGNIAKRLDLDPAKVPMATVERFGNQSSASIPCAICGELEQRLLAPEPATLFVSGFGVGLSWASALVRAGGLAACRVVDYPG